jgi:hypothetical protein
VGAAGIPENFHTGAHIWTGQAKYRSVDIINEEAGPSDTEKARHASKA